MEIEKEINQIKERNKKVELDKSWKKINNIKDFFEIDSLRSFFCFDYSV